MPRGSAPGERRGGRQKGTINKANALKRAEIAATGETPLDYMLRVMRDESAVYDRRDKAASAAAPFVHPKLAAIEHTGKDGADLMPPAADSREVAKAVLAILGSAVAATDKP